MKILHFSDTHLGFNDLEILSESNINQREADFYDAFTQVVTQIKEIRPDFIIHTGDLFHRASPSNRAITFALEQCKIIDSLGIPFILIAGNHSTPRTNLSSPILKIFENFENLYLSYEQKYNKHEFKDVVFHCLPHMNDETKALSQIELCEASIETNKKNIMMMHCSVGATYLMQEFGEWVYPTDKEYIFSKMDYVALGHWHGFGRVGKHENVYYSGSTERASLNDKRNSKGFALITLEDKLKVEYKEITIRPIYEFQIDCEDLEASIEALDLSNIKESICEVKLTNLTTMQSIDINAAEIKEIFASSLYTHLKREFKKSDETNSLGDIESLSLESYFIEHIKEESQTQEFERLKTKVQELFSDYEEAYSDTE